jgi:hypothetical protein
VVLEIDRYIPSGYEGSLVPIATETQTMVPKPFPTVPVTAAFIATIVVVAGVLVYFKKRKREV